VLDGFDIQYFALFVPDYTVNA